MEARLGVSRSIYVNVGTPNLGFTYFNFLGGELKNPPCILLDHRAINTKFLVSRIVVRVKSKGFKIHCKGSNSSESVSDYIKFRYICIHYSMMFLHRKWMMSYQSVQFICWLSSLTTFCSCWQLIKVGKIPDWKPPQWWGCWEVGGQGWLISDFCVCQ